MTATGWKADYASHWALTEEALADACRSLQSSGLFKDGRITKEMLAAVEKAIQPIVAEVSQAEADYYGHQD